MRAAHLTTMLVGGAAALVHTHQSVLKNEQVPGVAPVPMFTKDTMPEVSTTLLCIMNLTAQYFVVLSSLAFVRTINQLYGNKYAGAQSLLESANNTVLYAPMLSVLFLGCRMRAIQLTQGNTDQYGLPQVWAREGMQVASWSVLAQVLMVLLMPVATGSMKVPTDIEGNVDLEKLKSSMSPTLMAVMNIIKYVTMVSLYSGVFVVIYGIHTMEAPAAIWGPGGAPVVSPAVACTINLTTQFLVVYLGVSVVKTLEDFGYASATLKKLGGVLTQAKYTVSMAPMLCVLFIGARMRALQMDPKNGAPQPWAQTCFYLCAYSVLVQCLMIVAMPFIMPNVTCREGQFEGDVIFEGLTGMGAQILAGLRWACVLALYGGFTVVMYSVFVIKAPVGPTPPLSPAMSCVMNLTAQFFTTYLVLFLAQTSQQFLGMGAKVADIASQAVSTVRYAPMLSVLYIGTRMRALQLTKSADGTIPLGAGPQRWAQDCMFLSTWAVLVQVLLVIVLGVLYPVSKENLDQDGNVLPPKGSSPIVGYMLNALRYASMIAMYGGSCCIVYAVFDMTPETLPPYAPVKNLVPGIEVPQPPNPPTATFF